MKRWLLMIFGLFASATPNANAIEFALRAAPTTITLPDGQVVPMWGFALDSAPGANDGTVTVPGPALEIPPGDTTLKIHLTNQLPATGGQQIPVSVVIPGLLASYTATHNPNGRMRSFTAETLPGQTRTYTWSNVREGTFLYHSGTHPAVQVQMGLYGSLKKNRAPGEAYTGRTYDSESILLFSEIDLALHQAIANDQYGAGKTVTSTIDYQPKYFLLNGKAYSAGGPPLVVGTASQTILLRLINAGLANHVPVLLGLDFELVAQDGYSFRNSKHQYSAFLPAAKTLDALIRPTSAGNYPLFDRRLYGILTHLSVGPAARRSRQ